MATAQQIEKKVYPVVIAFYSKCCGVPSDSSVKLFIRSFKKQYKVKHISADHIGPMGREGEYYLAFSLKELNKKQVSYFKTKAKKIRKLSSDEGYFDVRINMEVNPSLLPGRTTGKQVIF